MELLFFKLKLRAKKPFKTDITSAMMMYKDKGHSPCPWRLKEYTILKRVFLSQFLLKSKAFMNDQIKVVKELNFDIEADHPVEILKSILSKQDAFMRCAGNHGITSSASAAAQFFAMMVFLEGSSGKTM